MSNAADDLLEKIDAFYCEHDDEKSYRAGVLCRLSLLNLISNQFSVAERISLLAAQAYWVEGKDLSHLMMQINNEIAIESHKLQILDNARMRAVMSVLLAFEYTDPATRGDTMSRFVEYIRIAGISEAEIESSLRNFSQNCLID